MPSPLSAVEEQLALCNRCGFCQAACPIFHATGHEAGVARGRIALLRALVEGRLGWSDGIEEPLFACLLCGACTEHCFPAVPTSDLIMAARAEYFERRGRGAVHRLLFDHLLPFPDRLRTAAKAVALGEQSGLSALAKTLGLLRVFGRDLARSAEIVSALPRTAFREKRPPGELEGRGPGPSFAYFAGCGMDIVQPGAAEATVEILLRGARSVRVLENVCCGLPAWSYGDLEAARRLAAKNLEVLSSAACDLIVTDCSSCASFLKRYPEVFPEGHALHQEAEAVATRVRDMLEVLPTLSLSPGTALPPVVTTYHDPCHACRGQGLREEPRVVLRSLPGIEFREMPEADWCCGGAGSYALSHYDLSMKVLERKMENLEKTGAELLVTSCPACLLQLSHGVRRRGLPVRVVHLSQVVRERLVGGSLRHDDRGRPSPPPAAHPSISPSKSPLGGAAPSSKNRG